MATIEVLQLEANNGNNLALTDISRHECSQLSYNEFYWRYMQNNWPVILTQVSNDWSCSHWTMASCDTNNVLKDNNQPINMSAINFNYLRNKIADCDVPVANCSKEYFNSHLKIEMRFHAFLDYWQNKINNERTNDSSTEKLYLKDWHLKTAMPNYDFYKVPRQFASDWLNEQLVAQNKDDYRFVYMGPKNTWTPFHADVFGSYSWSTNIVGCKKWLLLPPGEELKLADALGNFPFSIDEQQLQSRQVRFFKLYQAEHEAIFVPSGWYHQVWNTTDTISINHNWFNGCNITIIWRNLSNNMQHVIKEIEDCRQMDNFDEHCQTMLRASFGINYLDFLNMLDFICQRRLELKQLFANNLQLLTFNGYALNELHCTLDIKSIKHVLEQFLQDLAVLNNSNVTLQCKCQLLLSNIQKMCTFKS